MRRVTRAVTLGVPLAFLAVFFAWPVAGVLWRGLSEHADLSASKAKFTDDDPAGNRIPGSIDRVAALGMTLNDLGRWSGTVQTRYFGPRPLVEDGSVHSRSTLLTNLRLGYRLDKNLRLGLDVCNLFNRRASDIDYYYASQLRGEAAPVNDIHFHPVEPRGLRLTLSANF